jgi:teichuronic acid biosynthesis glycosyltransferase TuaG
MISIILPFYNADKYLKEAIQSVINQSIDNWELILINDGSTDNSKEITLSFDDRRIRYFEQENRGVSFARNLGLGNMNGDYFCFLDADDILPVNSLKSRFFLLKSHPFLKFADGQVKKFDQNLKEIKSVWNPNYRAEPLNDLLSLSGNSFLGLTWMIKREKDFQYRFCEKITHCEDLLFFMEIARYGGYYAFTDETILHYRDTPNSAMKNLKGLEAGYRYIENQIKNWDEISASDLNIYKFKYKKAMFLAYLRNLEIINAVRVIF